MTDYPVQLSIDYSDSSNRLTAFFRILLAIPIVLILAAVGGGAASGDASIDQFGTFLAAGGTLVVAPLLLILYRRKYPRWWFDWNLELARFSTRVTAYLMLLRDEYPSTDDHQAVHLDIQFPDAATELNRFLPIIKWALAIPHLIILSILSVFVIIVTVVAWFAILIIGRYPRPLFNFTVGALRWGTRVTAYAILLTTDRYPPFRLDA